MKENYSIMDAFKALNDIVGKDVNVSTIKTGAKKSLKEAIVPTTECQEDKPIFQDPYEEKESKPDDEDGEVVDNEEKEDLASDEDEDKDKVDEDIDPLEDLIVEGKLKESLTQSECEGAIGSFESNRIKQYCRRYEKDYLTTLNDILRIAASSEWKTLPDTIEEVLAEMIKWGDARDSSNTLKEGISEKDFQKEDLIKEISNNLSALIQDEWQAKDGYNNAVLSIKGMALAARGILDDEIVDKLITTLSDIGEEESVHVGELQELLSLLKPVEKTKIEDGHKEVEGNSAAPEVTDPEEEIKAEEESPVDESLKNKPLKEGEIFDIQNKEEGDKAKAFKDNDKKEEPIEQVVDPNANVTDDLKGSYVGNVILECPSCKTWIYKRPEELKKQDIPEGTEIPDDQVIYNIDEDCPHCGSKDGFTLVGQVAALTVKEADKLKDGSTEGESGEANAPSEFESGELESGDIDLTSMSEMPLESGEITNESLNKVNEDLNSAEVDLSIPLKEESPIHMGEPDEEDNIKEPTKFEILWYEGPDRETALQGDYHTEEFDTEEEAKDFYKSIKDDKDKFNFWPTERELDGTYIRDLNNVDESLSKELKESINNSRSSECVLTDLDEAKLDASINKYLTEVYDNVASYKTSDISVDRKTNQLLVEGIINFKDKKSLDTKFIFEGKDYNKVSNTLILRGLNEDISSYKDAFELSGKVDKGNFLTESLSYVYKIEDKDKTKIINGTIK